MIDSVEDGERGMKKPYMTEVDNRIRRGKQKYIKGTLSV